MISLKSDFIHFLITLVYNPEARAENPLGTNFWCQQKARITSTVCCKFQTNLFECWFYTHFLLFLHMYIAPGQGQTTLCGQNPDVKSLVILPICCNKISLKSDLYITFHVFIHVHSPGAGADNPLVSEFLYKHKPVVTLVICCKTVWDQQVWLYSLSSLIACQITHLRDHINIMVHVFQYGYQRQFEINRCSYTVYHLRYLVK